jgi:integrase
MNKGWQANLLPTQTRRSSLTARGTGSLYRQKGSGNWWIQYYRNGKPYRQSTGTTKRRQAEKLLQRKLAEIANHSFIEPKADRTRVKELAEDLLREYSINARKSMADVKTRWERHLAPVFADTRASNVSNDQISRYIEQRQTEGAANSTINREMAALKRMFTIGVRAKKVYIAPTFPHLEERNVRKGFVEESQYQELAKACSAEGLWLRAMFEVGYNFGWRVSELLNLRVRQIDLTARTIRLEPGETKNDEARTVVMTSLVYALLQQSMAGKQPDDYVFTRENGKPIRDFRVAWWKACIAAKVGRMVCPECDGQLDANDRCGKCAVNWKRGTLRYSGLIFHDLRRTAVRNLIRSGIPERVAMTISGHKTRAVFDRYNIVSESDLREAAAKLDRRDYDHSSDIVGPVDTPIANRANIN